MDLRDLVRETMSAYEVKTGRSLRWGWASSTTIPATTTCTWGAGYDRAGKQVGIYPRDLQPLRETVKAQQVRPAGRTRVTGRNRTERAKARLQPERGPAPDRNESWLQQVQTLVREMLDRGHQAEQNWTRSRSRSFDRGTLTGPADRHDTPRPGAVKSPPCGRTR